MIDIKAKEWTNGEFGYDVWDKKYRSNGESFDEWVDRISYKNQEVKQLILDKKMIPAGRVLSNRGLHKLGRKITYSNCYVLEKVRDSIEGIYDTAAKMARTFSYGGGVGIDITNLRPRGANVNNSAEETSGAVSFMDLFSLTTGLIGQNGRRGK